MNANRENFKALAYELLTCPEAKHLKRDDQSLLWDVWGGTKQVNAAVAIAINKIAERVRGVVA